MKPCSTLRELGRFDSGRETERDGTASASRQSSNIRHVPFSGISFYPRISFFSQVRRTTEVQVNE